MLISVNAAGMEAQDFSKKFHDLLNCGLYLGQAARNNQRSAEAIHKANLHISAFHCNVSSYYNRFPGGKAYQTDGFPCVVFSFMNTNVQPQILIDTGL